MPLIKTLLNYGVNKWRTMEQHPFVGLMVIFFTYFVSPMSISFPKFPVLYFLYLK